MENLVKIGNQEIFTKEFNNQRVVTFKDIDLVHERPEGTAGRNFRNNATRFIKNKDYFYLTGEDLRAYKQATNFVGSNAKDLVLVTESGYLMLVKSFTDDLAWEVQRQLVDTYFRVTKPLSQMEMMRIQLGMIDNHEDRITNLENNMTIDYGQQVVLGDAVNKTVINVLGGKDSNAYKKVGKKVFAECNRDLKYYFKVNARNNVPKKRFDEAVEYANNWKPCTNTMMLICNYNAQMNLA